MCHGPLKPFHPRNSSCSTSLLSSHSFPIEISPKSIKHYFALHSSQTMQFNTTPFSPHSSSWHHKQHALGSHFLSCCLGEQAFRMVAEMPVCPTLEWLRGRPSWNSWLQLPTSANPGRQQGWLKQLGSCHPSERSGLSFQLLASA